MREEPVVRVGIMSAGEINVTFNGNYTASIPEGSVSVFSDEKFVLSGGKVGWRGKVYDSLVFSASSEGDSFDLHDVTIGINFHWERKETQRFCGNLAVIVSDGNLVAVNVIGVESYLTSVISSEMSATASEELLKAHSVISRSWLLAQLEKNRKIAVSESGYSACTENGEEIVKWYDREDHTDFDVCADDHCQRYQGITRASTEAVRTAVGKTRGEVLVYGSEICDARFSKCCGGAVEEFQNCWEPVKHPYLVALRDSGDGKPLPDLTDEEQARAWILSSPDAFCNTTDSRILSQVLNNYDQETADFYRWKVEYTRQELSDLVRRRTGDDYGEIIDLIPVERGTSGRLVRLRIVGTKKSRIIGKELEIRRSLSESHLYSSAFVVDRVGDPAMPEKFILRGAGWGHGVGLCQIGAAVMGEKGYGYRDILLHYFVGAGIEKYY